MVRNKRCRSVVEGNRRPLEDMSSSELNREHFGKKKFALIDEMNEDIEDEMETRNKRVTLKCPPVNNESYGVELSRFGKPLGSSPTQGIEQTPLPGFSCAI